MAETGSNQWGDIVEVNGAVASELADARRRIHDLEKELTTTKLTATVKSTASMVKDDDIRSKGAYRSSKPLSCLA